MKIITTELSDLKIKCESELLRIINGSKRNNEKLIELEEKKEIINNKRECWSEQRTRKRDSIKSMEPDEREALERLINFHFNREFKKDETNQSKTSTSTISGSNAIDDRKIVSDPLKMKMPRKRGIIQVPDVVVVAGKSVVPKDLCSTRILTSRVLTAPSRATYTTAYI